MENPLAANITDKLQPGDCLLYKPASLFGWVIWLKTWHDISHVEVYAGNGMSYASRDGIGVGKYPLRTSQLAWILRPSKPLANLQRGFEYADDMKGTPYGWLELLAFVGIPVHFGGIVCSAFATELYRHAGWSLFPTDAAEDVAPFEFLNLADNGFTIV